MKAAVLRQAGAPFAIEEMPMPQIGPEEVLVKTRSCGICRTDLHIQDGLAYIPEFPHIPGHEPAGVVAAAGDRVKGIEVGQRVVPHLFVTCGHCSYCRSGRDAQCTDVQGILGVTLHGGFAEYFKAPARNLLLLPHAVSFEEGGLASCAVITAVHAYRRARLGVNDAAVVLGAGGIGQILVQILRAAGVKAAAVSRSQQSLEAAKNAGAEWTARLGEPNLGAMVRAFSGGDGVHCVFECVGTAATMKTAGELVRRGGQIVVIGEEPEFPEIDTIQIAQRELEILGSRNGSRQDAADSIAMMARGLIKPPVVRRYPLEEINEAMRYLRSGEAHGRLVVILD
ncbi:MAG: alcohol dehydrogenase catalytic domain-containing protein [Planctomycetes bacterium]|nr:alcohol dehydrogenase catalytic domain-containing protein [Planctomycetota bacterium]